MRLFALLSLFAAAAFGQCPASYSYQRAIIVNAGQVPSAQSNFPMLVLNPSASLKTVANGGHVQNSNGYDIIFVNGAGATLAFELVGHGTGSTTYSASRGTAEFWVNVRSLADGAVVYMCYGNGNITTYQGNDSTTWSGANRTSVYHFNETGASTAVSDIRGANNATLSRNASLMTTAGQVGNGFQVLSSDSIDFGAFASVTGATKFTASWWEKVTTAIGYANHFGNLDTSNRGLFVGNLNTSDCGGGAADLTKWFVGLRQGTANKSDVVACSATVESTNVWHHVAIVYDATQSADSIKLKLYMDGTQLTLGAFRTPPGLPATLPASSAHLFGAGNFAGLQDEFQMSVGTADPASWILTEYRNQSNPGAFYTVAGETVVSAGSGSITVSPSTIPAKHSGNITLTLTGTGTSWTGSTVFTLSGMTGVTKVNQNVASGTSATVVVTTGANTGTLLVTESVTGTALGATSVATAALAITPSFGNLNSIQTVTLTGTNTLWTKETAAGLFTVSGGTGASIGTPTITGDTAGTVAVTVGTAGGSLTITDTSTGATVMLVARGGSSGTYGFVFGQ